MGLWKTNKEISNCFALLKSLFSTFGHFQRRRFKLRRWRYWKQQCCLLIFIIGIRRRTICVIFLKL